MITIKGKEEKKQKKEKKGLRGKKNTELNIRNELRMQLTVFHSIKQFFQRSFFIKFKCTSVTVKC